MNHQKPQPYPNKLVKNDSKTQFRTINTSENGGTTTCLGMMGRGNGSSSTRQHQYGGKQQRGEKENSTLIGQQQQNFFQIRKQSINKGSTAQDLQSQIQGISIGAPKTSRGRVDMKDGALTGRDVQKGMPAQGYRSQVCSLNRASSKNERFKKSNEPSIERA